MPQAVTWLAGDWDGKAPLELTDQLIVVPTRQAGRRLREALAAHAAQQGQAVFPPRVIVPEQLLGDGVAAADLATGSEALLAWIEVLRGIDLTAFAEVFPVAPAARNFAWAARLAREFLRLQATLGENGLRLRDPADVSRFGFFPETTRWRQLAGLEILHEAALARRERRDSQAARIAFAENPKPPADIRRIVLLATPDPLPLVVRALEKLAATIAVDVVVFGPAEAEWTSRPRPVAESARTQGPALQPQHDYDSLFDRWGRPRVDAWRRREPDLPSFEEHVHLCPDPAAQAARLVVTARGYAEPARLFAVGIADREILAPLHNALQRSGLVSFNPDGRPHRDVPLYRVLALCGEFAREPLFSTVAALVRCPDVLAWLQTEGDIGFSSARFLAELDRLHAGHLPTTLDGAREHASPGVAAALNALTGLRAELTGHPFPENVRRALALVYGNRVFALTQPDDLHAVVTAGDWNETAARIADAAGRFPGPAQADLFDLARETFGDGVRFEEKPAGALELQGWLELLWEDAPHLVVAGLNDGHVPDAIVGDPFLPEALRERLGLKTNAARLARDAYLLAAIAACRRQRGRLDVLLGKVNSAGDPLRPSRLLLACDDTLLPARVQFLFRSVPGSQTDTPWRRAFQLTPPPPRPGAITHLSVTSFRNYLRCPFRFYLKHALRLEEVDPHKAELDDFDFGRLCHRALEALGNEARLRDCTDEHVLRDMLLAEFDNVARTSFGRDVPVPLQVQLESARQRLGRAAVVQARTRAEGWVIEHVERRFDLPVGGLGVRGTIDRIERHLETGRVRVLDYKTKDRATPPRASHVRRPKRNAPPDETPEYARFAVGDDEFIWEDLQLPLYAHALRAEYGDAISCGYFALPRAVSETAIVLWDDFGPAWQEASWRCAEGIVAGVRAGNFWPPAEIDPELDEFAALFHQGARESVAWRSP